MNQVQQEYNGLGQLTKEWQAHSGAVNTSTSPKVQYAYSEMAGGANHSRPTSMTYPNGRVLNFTYAGGLDSTISRLSSIDDSGVTLEAFSYLGQGSIGKRAHPQPAVDLTYIKQGAESNGDAGDQYMGLDRFGRVVDQRWLKTSDGSHTDRFKYGHDRNSSRLYRDNLLNDSFDELYHANGASAGYDQLNQLTDFRRGALSDTNSDNIPDTVTNPTRQQGWDFDALGTFDTQTSDGTPQARTHNKQNQSTVVGGNNLTFDANGNTTKDETAKQFSFDAWNRLILAKDSGGSTIATDSFDALGRRIIETVSGTTRDISFSQGWQVVEEQLSGSAKTQYVWSPVYIDALIARDRDADGNGSLEERLYAQQDANFNITSVINTSGSVVERHVYDAYGRLALAVPCVIALAVGPTCPWHRRSSTVTLSNVVVMLSLCCGQKEPAGAIPKPLDVEHKAIKSRQSIHRGELILKHSYFEKGVRVPRGERTTHVWFDGVRIRNDVLLTSIDAARPHREIWALHCPEPGKYTSYAEEDPADGSKSVVSVVDLSAIVDKRMLLTVDPRLLGMGVESVPNLARGSLDMVLARPDRKGLASRRGVWEGEASVEITYQSMDQKTMSIVVVPAWDYSVVNLQSMFGNDSVSIRDEVSCRVKWHAQARIWFPYSCVYTRVLNGVELNKEVVDVEVVSLNTPLEKRVFQIEGMSLRPGTPVDGLDPKGTREWDGEELRLRKRDYREAPVAVSRIQWRDWLLTGCVVLGLVSVIVLVQLYIRRQRA